MCTGKSDEPSTNPYAPPLAASELEPERPASRTVAELFAEAARALVTIVGIAVGWMLIAYGGMYATLLVTSTGFAVIGVSCLYGMGFRIRGRALSRSNGKTA